MRDYMVIALWIIGTAAWVIGFWAITESMKKARDAGYRYWVINPLAILHSVRSKEFRIFVLTGVIGATVVALIFALL